MSFKDAIHEVTLNLMTKLVVPNWAMGLTQRLRRVRLAFEELNVGFTTLFGPEELT